MSESKALDAVVAAYPKVESACTTTLNAIKFVTHWTFIPLVIFVGLKVSEPKPSLVQVFSPF